MKTLARFSPQIIIALGLAIGVFIHLHFSNSNTEPPTPPTAELGQVSSLNGQVSLLAYGASRERTLSSQSRPEDLKLHHLEMLITGPDSSAVINLPSGYELEAQPNSRLLLEAWGSEPSSPTYIHVISGDYKMLRAGQRGQTFIQQNRRLLFPEGSLHSTPYQLTIKAPEFQPAKPQAALNELDSEENAEPPTPLPTPESNVSASAELPNTLSNEEIDDMLASQRMQFERCQTNALRENLPAQGKILIGISISPAGKVQNVRAISSELNNPGFQSCVISVFERVQFRAFKGATITRSYPLLFD